MASTYSNTGIELIGVGEQANTWGQTTNTNWRLMEELVSGVVDISLNGLTSYTLTTVDGLTSSGRHMVIRFTGTPGGPVTVTVSPNEMQKVYLINNETTEAVTVAQGSGDTVEVSSNSKKIIYCDGEGATASVQDMFSGDFSGNFSGDFSGNFSGTGDFTSFSLNGTEVTISATQINESITAAGTSYDDEDASFEAPNVQDAIDVLDAEIQTTIQNAIDAAVQAAGQAAPPGAVQNFARQTPPDGWLEADGSEVSRTEYEALFTAIGTDFGSGDGSTTFNLPDLRGEFIRGWDNGRGVDSGRAFGSSQADENKEHSHGGSVGSVGDHTHSVTAARANRQWRGDGFTTAGVNETFSSGGAGSHSHSLSINNSGGAESRPRNIALLTCIKI